MLPRRWSLQYRLPILAAIALDFVSLGILLFCLSDVLIHSAEVGARRPSSAARTAALNAKAIAPAPVALAPDALQPLTPEQAEQLNAGVPFSTLPNPAADPFRLVAANPADKAAALTCLTMAVYYEAGNQSDQGEAAVAQVVLNRLRHPLFPKSVCGVVFEGSMLPTGCQFTFTCDGSLKRAPNPVLWKRAGMVAERALGGYVEPSVGEATHYHTVFVAPYWQSSLIKVAQIGPHIFYRWPGPLGMPALFHGQYEGFEQPGPFPGFDKGRPPVVNETFDAPPPLTAHVAEPAPVVPIVASVVEPADHLGAPLVADDTALRAAVGSSGGDAPRPRLPIPAW